MTNCLKSFVNQGNDGAIATRANGCADIQFLGLDDERHFIIKDIGYQVFVCTNTSADKTCLLSSYSPEHYDGDGYEIMTPANSGNEYVVMINPGEEKSVIIKNDWGRSSAYYYKYEIQEA